MSADTTTPAYQDFMQLVAGRHACRTFTNKDVSKEILSQVIEAARLAPSAKNKQPWQFIVLSGDDDRAAIYRAYDRKWIMSAPAYIVICADHAQSWRRADGKDHADIDLAIAGEHMALAATALGLGSCWVCNFNVMELSSYLGLPEGIEAVAIFPVCYPDPSAQIPAKNRKAPEEIVRWGK